MICMPGGLQLGPMGITFEQLFLVEVHQVSRASIRLTLAYESSSSKCLIAHPGCFVICYVSCYLRNRSSFCSPLFFVND